MELSENRTGAGRRIEEGEVDMAAAVFISVHRECGDAARIYTSAGRLVCYCEACEESRVYTYETSGARDAGP